MKRLLLILFVICTNISYSLNDDKVVSYTYDSRKLDSLDIKIKPFMDEKDYTAAAQCMLDKGKLLFDYGMYVNANMVIENALTTLSKSKDTTSDSFKDLYVECLNYKGVSLGYISSFDKALECYIKIEKYNNNENNKYAAKAYNGMGIIFGMNRNNALAEEYYRKAMSVAKKVPNFNLFPIYSNLAAVFLSKKELDSALAYSLDAHKIALENHDIGNEIASLQSLGMINFQLGKHTISLRYYNEACDIAIKTGNYSPLSFLKFNMIRSYVALGDYDLAFSTANESLQLARQMGLMILESISLKELSKLYEKQGNYKKSLECLQQSLRISDSLFNHDSEDKLLRQKADFDLYRTQSEKALTENELALELANSKISNIVTLFLVILLIIVSYILVRGLRKQYKINKQLHSRIEGIQNDDKNMRHELQEEIETKSRELTSTSLLIVKFNELSYLLGKKLKILKANLSQRSKEMDVIKEMEELISQFISQHSLEQFKQYYEQVPAEFYEQLDIRYPDLTMGEKRICALISMNMSSKEIALLTGKNISAIEVTKSRIRKKMNIGSDVNLKDIL